MKTGRILDRVGADKQHQLFGVYGASVYNNRDPKNQGRIEMRIPQVLGTAISNWADRLSAPSNKGVPKIGEYVTAMFIGGDINRPAYLPAAVSFAPITPQPSAWTAISLSAGWSNTSGSASAQYRTTANGDLEIIGNIQGGTVTDNTTIGTVPILPAHAHTFPATAIAGGAANATVTTGFTASTVGAMQSTNATLNNLHGGVDSGTQIPTGNFTITSGSLPFTFGPGGQTFSNNAGASTITLNSGAVTITNGNVNVPSTSVGAQTASVNYNSPCIKIDTSGNLKVLNLSAGVSAISFHHTIPLTA